MSQYVSYDIFITCSCQDNFMTSKCLLHCVNIYRNTRDEKYANEYYKEQRLWCILIQYFEVRFLINRKTFEIKFSYNLTLFIQAQ